MFVRKPSVAIHIHPQPEILRAEIQFVLPLLTMHDICRNNLDGIVRQGGEVHVCNDDIVSVIAADAVDIP
jgi:hypothetical protein